MTCFRQTSHKGRALPGHLVYLSSRFRDEKPEAKKGSHSELPSWWVAGAPGVLPPVPFPAERAASTPGSMLCSPGFSSTGPRPGREPGRGVGGLAAVSSPQGERSSQPALEIPSAYPWEQADGSSATALNALCSQSGPDRQATCSETSLCSPLNTVFFFLRSRHVPTSPLDFAFPGVFLPNYSALPLHWKVLASASFHLDNNF